MKKFLIFLILFVVCAKCFSQKSEIIDVTPLGFSGNFEFLQYSKTRGLLALSNKSILYVSSDTAKTWETEKLPLDTINYFVMHSDGLVGFIKNKNTVYRTTDGSLSWEQMPLEGISKKIDGYEVVLERIHFKTRDTLFLVLTNKVNGKRIYKSCDCGVSWKEVAKDIQPRYTLLSGFLNNIHWRNENEGYFYGQGQFVKTIDGGDSWTMVNYSDAEYEKINWLMCSYKNGTAIIAEQQNSTNRLFFSKDGNPQNRENVLLLNIGEKIQEVNGVLYAVQGDYLWQSIDSAKTWNSTLIKEGANITSQGMYFYDNNVGVTISKNLTSYVTTDGGETWTKYVHGGGDGFNNIYCKNENENECFITGKTGRVFSTKDGGETWETQNVHDGALYEIEFPSNEVGYIVGPHVLFKTTNGGTAWEMIQIQVTDAQYIDFFSENVGYLGYSNMIPSIHKTEDGGKSWKRRKGCGSDIYREKASGITKFSFRDENEGVVCGANTLLHTIDGGETWELKDCVPENTYSQSILSIGNRGWLLHTSNHNVKNYLDRFFFYDNDFNGTEIFSGVVSDESGNLQKINDTTYKFSYDTLDFISTDEGLSWNPIYTGLKGQRFFVNKNLGYSITNNQIYKYCIVPTEIQMEIIKNNIYNYSLIPVFNGNQTTVVLYLTDENNTKNRITEEIVISNGMPVTIEIPASLPLGSYTLYVEAQDKNYLSTNVGIIVLEKSNAITDCQLQSPIYRVDGKILYVYDAKVKLYTVLGTEIPLINGYIELKTGVYILVKENETYKIVI